MKFNTKTIALILLFASTTLFGADKTWIANSGSWSVNGNWSPFGRPADFDNVSLFGANSMSKTVTYDINDGLLHVYGTIGIQSAGFGTFELRQPGTSLEASNMSIAGTPAVNGRARHVLTAGGSAFVGSTFIADLGLLSVGSGCGYEVTDLTQDAGTITIDPAVAWFRVNGKYDLRGGSVTGPVLIQPTGGLAVEAPTVGAAIDNFGSIAINANTNFTTSLINRAPLTILGPRDVTAQRWDQRNSDVTQFGTTHGTYYFIQGGSTWNLMGGIHTGTQITTGFTAGDGTYSMAGGSVNMNGFSTARIIVGMENSGSFLQSGGDVRVPFLYVGGSGTLGSGRGYYRLSGTGSLLCTGQMWVGTDHALGGTYEQTGGNASIARLIVNENGTSSGAINLSGGSLLINSTSINNGAWNQTGGRARVDGFLDGTGSTSVTGTGSMSTARIRQNSVSLADNAHLIHEDFSPTHQVNLVNSLTFNESGGTVHGTWDLDNSSLAIDYTGASPIASINRYLKSGYAGGSWTGTGLSSALAGAFQLSLGLAEASDVLGATGGNFQGLAVDGSTVLVKFTFPGDANLDGTVDLFDFNRLSQNFGRTGRIWSQGDFNYDGSVDLLDFNILSQRFGQVFSSEPTPHDWAQLASSVPEPATVLLLLSSVPALAGMRFRRKHRSARSI
jgi:hypothetical protein